MIDLARELNVMTAKVSEWLKVCTIISAASLATYIRPCSFIESEISIIIITFFLPVRPPTYHGLKRTSYELQSLLVGGYSIMLPK